MIMPNIDDFLDAMTTRKASDLYLTHGSPPILRINDATMPIGQAPLDDAILEHLKNQLINESQRDEFASTLELNTAINWKGTSRFRVNLYYQQNHIGIVLRCIQIDIPSLDELNLPPIYGELAMLRRGLVLVVGPTGAGKTSSLAAMVGHRNTHGSGHIITVEDPIEYVHTHKNCIITQRDIGIDTYSYAIALKNALRQRPDMVVVGEIRDREVMEQALYFAETGHLCIATLHANNASQAIERIQNFFPEEQHRQILYNLSIDLRGILSQRLIRNTKGSRAIACEIMLNTGLIRTLIEENKVRQIHDMIERGKSDGMQTFDQHLLDLLEQGIITEEVALSEAENAASLRMKIRGKGRTVASQDLLLRKSAFDLKQ
jgi:twitching motility protein PilU